MKQVLFLVSTAPYGSAAIPESARSCMGFGTMPFEIGYLLAGDAVWALAPGQKPEGIGLSRALDLVTGLADLDVKLYAENAALQERGLSAEGLGVEVTPVSPDEMADLIANADVVMTY